MGFDEFTRKNIVPACILAPTKESFDWRDAQTVLVCPHMYNNITADCVVLSYIIISHSSKLVYVDLLIQNSALKVI